jgi:glutathione synthase/RimK-type ligase-like ATP-grasp enzyme
MKKIALAVCHLYKDKSPCDDILANALKNHGYSVTKEVWNDPNTKWEYYDLVILRSACDYIDNVDSFLNWVSDVSTKTTLINNEEVIKNNCNKLYLKKLENKGISIIPTQIADSLSDLIAVINNCNYDDIVIKHTLGAKGLRTYHFKKDQIEQIYQTISDLPINKKTPILVQPYIHNLKENGEISAMYFDGVYSFAVKRKPITDDITLSVKEEEELYNPSYDEIEFCNQVMSVYEFAPVYAKIDYVNDNGKLLLVKTGFIEPNLYFHVSPSHVEDFIKAIKKYLT